MIDTATTLETTYTYDIDDPATFGSANNRLMESIKEEVSTGPIASSSVSQEGITSPVASATGVAVPSSSQVTRTLLETTWYYYNDQGNVTRVVTNQAGTSELSATRFGYALNGKVVTFVEGETWTGFGFPMNYNATYAREFRYDSGRQRYLKRELDPALVMVNNFTQAADRSNTWSDYDGDVVYGDYTISLGADGKPDVTQPVNELRLFQPGIATAENDPLAGTVTRYYHTDLIGTTRGMTDQNGQWSSNATVYTAFGEQVGGTPRRYGYAGAFGYQTDDTGNFPFLHVGARYYDPSSGRFLQRDPIGMEGGTNVYAYAGNNPTIALDPDGKFLLLLLGVAIIVIDAGAQYANAPAPGDSTLKGSPGPSGASVVGGVLIGIELVPGLRPPGAPPPVGPYRVGPEPTIDPNLPPPVYFREGDHVVPSIPRDLPPGPMPPYNPDDFGTFMGCG